MKTLLTIVAIVLIVDAIAMVAWALSGQQPESKLFIGTLSTHAVQWVSAK